MIINNKKYMLYIPIRFVDFYLVKCGFYPAGILNLFFNWFNEKLQCELPSFLTGMRFPSDEIKYYPFTILLIVILWILVNFPHEGSSDFKVT